MSECFNKKKEQQKIISGKCRDILCFPTPSFLILLIPGAKLKVPNNTGSYKSIHMFTFLAFQEKILDQIQKPTVHTTALSKYCNCSITRLFTKCRLQGYLAEGSMTGPDKTNFEKNPKCANVGHFLNIWQHLVLVSKKEEQSKREHNCGHVLFSLFCLLLKYMEIQASL
jgi:hypothetical protein